MAKSKNIDMLHGSLWDKMVIFALPLALTGMLQTMIYEQLLGYVPEGEEAELVKNIDDACLYYEFDHFMNEKLFPVEPVLMSSPEYEFQPMADVEKEFLSLFEDLKKRIEKEAQTNN